jgi:hypothetical protein
MQNQQTISARSCAASASNTSLKARSALGVAPTTSARCPACGDGSVSSSRLGLRRPHSRSPAVRDAQHAGRRRQ